MAVRNNAELEITNEEFHEVVNNSHKLVAIHFFAEWSMPCVMISPVIEDLSQEIKEVKFAKVNIDDNEELACRYKVSSVPCMIIFKDGEEVERILGVRPIEFIEQKIRSHLD